jgi:CTP:molybdopterin cytidylyltransferase MocA
VIAGLILAAGEGSRFGARSKLLAELDGRPLLEHAVAAQSGVAELERIVVVLGSRAQEILAAVDLGRAEPVVTERWSEGQSMSLRAGLARVFGEWGAERAIVTLGDQPLISVDVVRRFVGEPPGTRAVYAGVPGHPVVLGVSHYRALAAVSGDRGARALLDGGRRIECGALAPGLDVDTPADLERAAAVASGAGGGETSGGGPDAGAARARQDPHRA